jgi:hypothetical protein
MALASTEDTVSASRSVFVHSAMPRALTPIRHSPALPSLASQPIHGPVGVSSCLPRHISDDASSESAACTRGGQDGLLPDYAANRCCDSGETYICCACCDLYKCQCSSPSTIICFDDEPLPTSPTPKLHPGPHRLLHCDHRRLLPDSPSMSASTLNNVLISKDESFYCADIFFLVRTPRRS